MATSQLVDWQLLRHSYGDASDIPLLLKQIDSKRYLPDYST